VISSRRPRPCSSFLWNALASSEARSLPALRDPFDRLIAGTAVALGVPLITPDVRIAAAPRVRVIW
jgi:PIN domain nuclease of toxin-antitoxin system